MNKAALILFAHGARAASWAAPFERLRALTAARLPQVTVRLAFLELMTPSLPELVAQLAGEGADAVDIVPVFLGQGGHVQRDLPQMVEQLRAAYPQIAFGVAGAVGEDAQVLNAMADYCAGTLVSTPASSS